MRRYILLAAVLVGSGFLARADAQGRPGRDRGLVEVERPGVRGGFYVGGGFGYGMEQYKYSDENSYTDRLGKPTVTIRLGGTPSEQVRLGGELFGWNNSINDGVTNSETFGVALMSVQFFPAPQTGFYLKAGAGLAGSGVSYHNGSSTNETGFGFGLGAGYEWQASRSLSVGPTIDWYQGSFTKRDQPTLTERVLNIGVQVIFQTGSRR